MTRVFCERIKMAKQHGSEPMPDTLCVYENARLNVTYLFGRPVRFVAKLAAGRDELLSAVLKNEMTLQQARQSPFVSDDFEPEIAA